MVDNKNASMKCFVSAKFGHSFGHSYRIENWRRKVSETVMYKNSFEISVFIFSFPAVVPIILTVISFFLGMSGCKISTIVKKFLATTKRKFLTLDIYLAFFPLCALQQRISTTYFQSQILCYFFFKRLYFSQVY